MNRLLDGEVAERARGRLFREVVGMLFVGEVASVIVI